MKYTIEIPTIESIETLTATAHKEAQKWLLEKISSAMIEKAKLGHTDLEFDLSDCPYAYNQLDLNKTENTLREIGYMTDPHPRKQILIVDWSARGKAQIQILKDSGVNWKRWTDEDK